MEASDHPQSGEKRKSGGASDAPVSGNKRRAVEPDIDKLLPRTHLARIMKKVLPPDATISPEALRVTQSCVKTLIACISTEAGIQALMSKRRIVGGEDVVTAIGNVGFSDVGDLTKLYVSKFHKAKKTVDGKKG